jgi:hypothetical protein
LTDDFVEFASLASSIGYLQKIAVWQLLHLVSYGEKVTPIIVFTQPDKALRMQLDAQGDLEGDDDGLGTG